MFDTIHFRVCVQGFFPIRAGCASDLALLRSSEIALWGYPLLANQTHPGARFSLGGVEPLNASIFVGKAVCQKVYPENLETCILSS